MKKSNFCIFAFLLLAANFSFAARPIARWDIIPFQTFTTTFKAGVVAFHEKGVRVDFYVNGKCVAKVDKPSLNSRTQVLEHHFELDASKYDDGPITLGAIANTKGEPSFKLPNITLYANSKKTVGSRKVSWVDPLNGNDFAEGTKDTPFKTLKQAVKKAGDGGYVLLLPGIYQAKMIGGGLTRKYWTTLMPAPGVNREQVKFYGGRTGTDKIRFKNVELYSNVADGYNAVILGEKGETMAWFDQCKIANKKGRFAGITVPFGNKLNAYVTGGETTDIGSGPVAKIIRNHKISKLAGNCFSGSNFLAVNCEVEDIEPTIDGVEPDFYKAFAPADKWIEDVILSSVNVKKCNARALSGTRFRNSAIVNVEIDTKKSSTLNTQFFGPVENVIFTNVAIKNQPWQWMMAKNGRDNFIPKDVRLFGVKCDGFSGYDSTDGTSGLTITSDYDILYFPKGEK